MFGLTRSVGKRSMPTGLREIESSFKQVQKDYQSYAKRRQVLAIELLYQEKEAFEVFRKEVLQDLQAQCAKMQVEQERLRLHQHWKGCINLGNDVQHTCQEMHYQDLVDPPEIPDQRQACKSEQAQLVADLQDRLDHLAEVTASLDQQR
ncbi:hypothetical protein ABBQ38_009892 [Trebouxia sp. C0009 RCD-2024]